MPRTVSGLALLGAVQIVIAATPSLMPMPAKVETATGKLAIDATFGVAGDVEKLHGAVPRFLTRVARQTGIFPSPTGRGGTLQVACSPCTASPALAEDESYLLDVTASSASLKAATVAGAQHGLETFLQLIEPGPEGFQVAAVHIEDRPRFRWRGLMLDCSRHFLPVEVIERNLDAMAAVKLNVFHWHLSDDQGFRAESLKFPNLQRLGSDGLYYTQQQMREVVAYAAARSIRVVPEFDIPGHTLAWFPGMPELAAGKGPFEIGRRFGVFDPVLDPTRDEIYAFLDSFIGEMSAIFPDPFFHIGGDEVSGNAWKNTPSIQAFATEHKLKDTLAIQTYFNRRVLKILEKYNKTMIGWDEILGPDLPQNAVIQSWRGANSLAEAAGRGFRGILSAGYYLDHVRPASYHYAVDPLGGPAAQLTAEQAARVLGGEACMWAEMVDAETVDSRLWPRTAAIAERFWSPKELTDVDSMYARMEAVSHILEFTGVTHRSHYDAMLVRLAGGQPVGPLRVVADAAEARGLGTGRRAHDTQTPLNRLVDAARPESESVRRLELLARGQDAASRAALRAQFAVWSANDAQFLSLYENNALLAEIKPLSKDLSALGSMGLQILDYLSAATAAPADWVDTQRREVTRMQRPNAEVLLAATRPVKLLLDELAKRN